MALHAGEARPDGVHDRPQPTAGIGRAGIGHASTVPACLTLYGGLEGWRAGGLEGWRGKPSLPRMDEVRPWEAVGIEKA